MPTTTIALLGAFAGLTIYLGLPIAFLKRTPQALKIFLNMLATGVLIFLLFDVVSKASDPINSALDEMRTQHLGMGLFSLDVSLFVLGTALGSVGLVYFNRTVFGRIHVKKTVTIEGEQHSQRSTIVEKGELTAPALALLIATGIGLHNFSEGLAIGQSAATGALQLAMVLIIGFGLHNMTEGFGIAGPLTGQPVSWGFVALLGLIGGGPTFLGTIVGIMFHSPQIFILFLALAAGAIIYVIVELLGMAKRFKAPELVMWGLLIGFLLGYATDLIVTYGGA
jgi:ZIP family zinc transporter